MGTPDYQSQINALTARLALIDGQGLTNPSACFETVANAGIAGAKTDISQAVLALESQLNTIQAQVNQLQGLIQAALGVTGTSGQTNGTQTPPPLGN